MIAKFSSSIIMRLNKRDMFPRLSSQMSIKSTRFINVKMPTIVAILPCMTFATMMYVRPACAYAQSDQSLCSSLEYSMSVKLLTEYLLEVLSLKGG